MPEPKQTSQQQTSRERVDHRWAWAAFEPSRQQPWDLPQAVHLFRRAGFGATWAELQQALRNGPQKTVERLVTGDAGADAKRREAFYAEVRNTGQTAALNVEGLPGWWLYVMLHTPHPLLEKMTLFWHGHFATSGAKVDKGDLMLAQNELLREHALRPFGPLLRGMARDVAMLLWLDSASNKKFKPNENFAREVMELFCLGLGNYTEKDIKEAARAFTGWEVRHERFVFNPHQHDEGAKTVLGQRGNWNGDDVLRILLEQPAAGRFLAGKVYRYFISDTAPPPALIEPLADGYRKHNYDTAWLVRTVLSSNLFYSPHAIVQKIKAPVEMAIGLVRALEGTTNTVALAEDLRKLGQGVFYPPNVKGWDGGAEWINSSTLLSRVNLVWAIVSGRDGRYKHKVQLDRLAAKYGQTKPADTVRWLADLLLGAELPKDVYVRLTALAADDENGDEHLRLARVVQAIAALPEFHVA
jgi:uncharacterized protein (DUF1800 family)